MKLSQKLILAALPSMILGIVLIGTLSYLHSRDLIYQYEKRQLEHYAEQFINDFVDRRQRILERTNTENIPSFVDRYRAEAIKEIDTYANQIGRHVSIFDTASGDLVLHTDHTHTSPNLPDQPIPNDEAWRIAQASDTKSMSGVYEEAPYAAAAYEKWNWALVISADRDAVLGAISKIGIATVAVTLVTALLTVWIFNRITRRAIIEPVQKLKTAAARFARGEAFRQIPIQSSDEIGELARDFERMAQEISRAVDEAKAANESKSVFLANMSHEIRTPMNGVMGMAQLLEKSDLDEQQRHYLRVILESGTRLKSIIDDILDLSKLDAAQVSIESLPVELNALVEQVCALFRPDAEARGNRLLAEVPEGDSVWVMTDPTRLHQCIANLVSNANKFTSDGKITVALSYEARSDDRIDAEISVTDTGIGVPESAQAKLFERFTQSDASTTRRFGGTGLGLPIVKELVRLMRGQIDLQSVQGEGSTFTLSFSWQRSEPQAPKPELSASGSVPDLTGLRVLVAEDNRINQILIQNIFEPTGADCQVVGDGLEAVEAALERDYDLILMDVQMPNLDGVEAMRRIRQASSPRAAIPIVALTANAMAGDRERYLAEGFTEHFAKPIDVAALYAQIEAITGAGRRSPGPCEPLAALG